MRRLTIESGSTGRSSGRALLTAAAAALLLLAAVLGVGCTSDSPNGLGSGQVDSEIEVALDVLSVDQWTGSRYLAVRDTTVPLGRQEAVYLGSQEGTSSSILVNYDFSAAIDTATYPLAYFHPDSIRSVNLRLLALEYYQNLVPPEKGADKMLPKIYEAFQLDAPFDSTAYPAAEPPHSPFDLNLNPIQEIGAEVRIPIDKTGFANWFAEGGRRGFLIREAEGSVDGLLGFSARDMKHGGSTLATLDSAKVTGPAIIVSFKDPVPNLVLAPYADCSTFHEIGPPPASPAEGILMRTCLRSYPALRFDFSALPKDVFINRAVLAVTNDPTRSFGNLESIVISELDTTGLAAAGDSLTLDELDAAAFYIGGMSSLDPLNAEHLEFNVTSAVQRIVNEVYAGDRWLVLTAGEDFLPDDFDLTTVDPDLFFVQFNFFGTDDPDSTNRPRLKVTYSSIDEVTGGGK